MSNHENSNKYHKFQCIHQNHTAYQNMKDYKQALPSYEKFLSLSKDKNPDEEFKARQRVRVIQKELSKH